MFWLLSCFGNLCYVVVVVVVVVFVFACLLVIL